MSPILLSIGPFHVFAFGFFLSLSFLISTFLIYRYGREYVMDEENLMDTFVYTCLVSLISARIFYIVLNFEAFSTNILKYFIVRDTPGLSLTGAIIGGALYIYLSLRKNKYLSWRKVADIFSLTFCFAFSLVSIGELLGGGSYGRLSDVPWGIYVVGLEGKRHPVELYAAIAFFLLFIILSFLKSKLESYKQEGILTLFFLLGLGSIVFLLEFFKESPLYLYGGISLTWVLALPLILCAGVVLFKRLKALYLLNKNKKI